MVRNIDRRTQQRETSHATEHSNVSQAASDPTPRPPAKDPCPCPLFAFALGATKKADTALKTPIEVVVVSSPASPHPPHALRMHVTSHHAHACVDQPAIPWTIPERAAAAAAVPEDLVQAPDHRPLRRRPRLPRPRHDGGRLHAPRGVGVPRRQLRQ